MATTQRFFRQDTSEPTFTGGACPKCDKFVAFVLTSGVSDNRQYACPHCGSNTLRFDLVRHSLAIIEPIAWSLFASDMFIGEKFEAHPDDVLWYDVQNLIIAKWQHQESTPNASSGERYIPGVTFGTTSAVVSFQDSLAASGTSPDSTTLASVSWFRFGLSSLGAVPAWRQSLFGAATLIDSNPPAAIVLIAAGFETFFLETMRAGWQEKGISEEAFNNLNRNNPAISYLVRWLPSIVGRPSLTDSPILHEQWQTLVNRRRNEVVHSANVHFTTEEARESMRTALECITYLDPVALVRPHVYYVSQ